MKVTKEPQVNTHLDWRNWWRMPSHEYGDVPQHLFTSKFMARRTTNAVESNIGKERWKLPFLVAVDIKITDFRSFHLQCPNMFF